MSYLTNQDDNLKEDTPGRGSKRERLRWGFSTGTAAVAAALAAFRHLVAGQSPGAVAVRLPSGIYLPVPIHECLVENGCGLATVIKDGGDDPDVTHKAKIRARVRVLKAGGPVPPSGSCSHPHLADGTNSGAIQSCPKGGFSGQAIKLIAGEGVGIATKAGLPIAPGEPAINPVPRGMFSENLSRELLLTSPEKIREKMVDMIPHEGHASVLLPLGGILDELVPGIILEVEIQVPGGEALARHTLNPRLGVVGGISILGTTGIVKPFSNEAYEETIRSALAVAASNGCSGVVLSTGGKSERFAKSILPDEPVEAFVQVADFFSFSVREARRFGFRRIVHSVFFGKAVKMAQGHEYTHAHSVAMDLSIVAEAAKSLGYEEAFRDSLISANTARHAMDMIAERKAYDVVRKIAARALARSIPIAGEGISVRLLLFDFDGHLLADVS